jgi:uracil-DNA glycosylase
MSPADEPFALKDPAERKRRAAMLSLPHMQPLVAYLRRVKASVGPGYDMPDFDPCDGGIRAKLLFLLEAPGPKAVGSTFISRNNPDQTARNMNLLLRTAGITREDTLLWNIVPWYVGTGQKIRPVDKGDIAQAIPYLRELIQLLPDLRGIVLVGKKAQSASAVIRRITPMPLVETHHPSRRVFNVWPEKRDEAQAVFNSLQRFLTPAPVSVG